MNKSVLSMGVMFLLGVGGGVGLSYYLPLLTGDNGATAPASGEVKGDKPLFYRNPMNPAITSPVPAKDEMGMDYIPVYPEKPAAEKKPLFYRNPMNPAITSPVPAQDEMGMDYIPVYADGDSGGSDEPAGTVKIDPVVVQNIGVRTVAVTQQDLAKSVRASGRVTVDEGRMARLHPRTEGWVEKQFAARIGDSVRRGDDLLQLYAPQLVTSQQEYLLALENHKALVNSDYADIRNGAKELVESAYQRLRLLDMPEHEIRELRVRGVPSRTVSIESPFDGVVLSIGAREGQYIMPNTELYMLADLSKVWLLADVYEYELPWVRVGDKATARITGLGDRQFVGSVSYIYPYAEAKTRTVKVRIEFDNPDGLLKPDMFASVTIGADAQQQALVIPSEAVVRSGSREQVFVVRGEGKYEPREVTLGYSSDGLVEVRSGLKLGERVVNSALFLIDSESKLREATAKMMEASQAPANSDLSMDGMDMGGLSMDGMSMDGMSMDGMNMDELSMDRMSMDGMNMQGMSMDAALGDGEAK
ncbi:efflux RND transporter periplasmic adaptor subunit [Motiliproteus sp. SC1-56]|uniref:efflux RND transporter periplasmic adaptor subunit n=1 Tax=Motiliproteus sp. SC1-56 TaxID=2799565 RepID=UPI001A8E6C93|nr:efflux RND transporter periplasmic adaptor subunit [Motiliproteus sp. SC1-56]